MVGTLQPPCLSVSNTEWRRHHHEDETAGMEKTNRLIASGDKSNLWGARPEQILPSLRGLEVRKYPAAGEVFFLDFPFYRTSQDLAKSRVTPADSYSPVPNEVFPFWGLA